MTTMFDGARGRLPDADGELEYARLAWLTDQRIGDVERLPQTVRILLENLLRRAGTRDVADEDVAALAAWPGPAKDIAFMPARVLMQDFTGVPAGGGPPPLRRARGGGRGGPPPREPPLAPA